MKLLLCLVLALSLYQSVVQGQCCTKDKDFCPIPDFTEVYTSTCSFFGTGHIHTFDGLAYDFHEYGDYLFADTGSTRISLRLAECKAATTLVTPIAGVTEGVKSACAKSVLVQSMTFGSTEFFRNDPNDDFLSVSDNQNTPVPASMANRGHYSVKSFVIDDPYSNKTQSEKISNFEVRIQTSNGFATITFYEHGVVNVVLRVDAGRSSAGLCGNHDLCRANELTVSRDPEFPRPEGSMESAAAFLEKVGDNNGNKTFAGDLNPGDEFINDPTLKNQDKWMGYFASSWKRRADFYDNSRNYNIRYVKTSYKSSYEPCKSSLTIFPGGVPSTFLASCGADRKLLPAQSNTVTMYPYRALLLSYCMDWQNEEGFSAKLPGLTPHHCAGVTSYAENFDEDLHAHYDYKHGDMPDLTFPGAQQGSGALRPFSPDLALAGDYYFMFFSFDTCQLYPRLVKRTLKCAVDLPKEKNYTMTVNRDSFGVFPSVHLLAAVPAGAVQVSWQMVSDNPPYPTVGNLFVFEPLTPGVYVFEYVVYSGCSIRRSYYTIHALCAQCVNPSRIASTPVKEAIFGSAVSPPQDPAVPMPWAEFPDTTFDVVTPPMSYPPHTPVKYVWDLLTTAKDGMAASDDLLVDVRVTGTPTRYNVGRYLTEEAAIFAQTHPSGYVLTSGVETQIYPAGSNAFGDSVDPRDAEQGPTYGPYGVYPPQLAFYRSRESYANYRAVQTAIVVETVTWELYTRPILEPVCQFDLSDVTPGGERLVAEVSPITSPLSDSFIPYAGCEGKVKVRMTSFEEKFDDERCPETSDVVPFLIECGPRPQVIVDCNTRVNFDYSTRSFAAVSIDAGRSKDEYNRAIYPRMELFSAPEDATATIDSCWGCTTREFTVDKPGKYVFQVDMSNECNYGTSFVESEAVCSGLASDITATVRLDNGAPSNLVYFDGTQFSLFVDLAGEGSSVTPNAVVFGSWKMTAPADVVPPSQISWSTSAATYQFHAPGSYMVSYIADQGCDQTATAIQNVKVICDTKIKSAVQKPTQTFLWDDAIPGFPVATITATSTITVGSYPTLANSVITYGFKCNDGPCAATGDVKEVTYQHTLAASLTAPLVVPFSLLTEDGCVRDTVQFNYTYTCLPIVPAILRSSTGPIKTGVDITFTSNGARAAFLSTSFSTNTTDYMDNTAAPFTATYAYTRCGTFEVVLTLTDGCNSEMATKKEIVVVECPQPLTPVATVSAGAGATLRWHKGKFGLFDLDGNSSAIGTTDVNTISYEWQVVSAPQESLYAIPNPVMTETDLADFWDIDTVEFSGLRNTTESHTIVTQEVTLTLTEIYLQNTNVHHSRKFTTCFPPDLPGDYSLVLHLDDGCQTKKSAPLVVSALCAQIPTIVLNLTAPVDVGNTAVGLARKQAAIDQSKFITQLPNSTTNNQQYMVKLSRESPRRIYLDASRSISHSETPLSFYWAWRSPDTRAGSENAQASLDTAYGPIGSFFPSPDLLEYRELSQLFESPIFYLELVVHDGCGVNKINVTLYTSCETPLRLNLDESSVTVRPPESPMVLLQNLAVDPKTKVNSLQCRMADWLYFGFVEEPMNGEKKQSPPALDDFF